ncbi:MAG TPA: ribonuclease HII [Candidatus Paceibacterota bacterium]|nr:ribonuclease HII [Candidatus Paceibacterota bacterium]
MERSLLSGGYRSVIGVDEVGMACLAGPVTVCAVMLGPEFFRSRHDGLRGLRDSKLLRPHQREAYAAELKREPSLRFCIASAMPRTIDRLNIFWAARLAMRRAVRRLAGPDDGCMVLVDGNLPVRGLGMEQLPVVKGDRKVFTIACASVIAKVHRDGLMTRYARRYPGYGFEVHKGYPTRMHRERLAALGATELHRRTFSGII